MPIKIPQLPSIPAGTVTGQTSIPVSKTSSDPKTYKMSLNQALTWIQANGGGTGAQGAAGAQGGAGAQGSIGGPGAQGTPGVQGASGYTGVQGASGSPGLVGSSGYQGFIGPQGFEGVSGYQGFQGSMGSNTGQPGPGLVYTGYYKGTSATYYNFLDRKDVVSYSGIGTLNYYYANSTTLTATSGASGWGVPDVDTANWSSFGQNFKSVATGLLLTEDAAVTKTITLGEVSNLSAGIIRSANCDNFADGEGFWLGNDAQGRTGFFVGNSAGPSYMAYDSSVGAVVLSGTLYANAGRIASLGIADYTYGSSTGTVLYTGTYNTPGTSATPIFLNGRQSGSYGNGEVIFGLGSGLVYYYLSAGGGTYVARLNGEIIANAGSIGGVGLNQGYIWSGGSGGVGYFANDNTPFWVNGNPNPTTDNYFSLGSSLVYYKTGGNAVLAVSGTITANAGSIGGVGINQGYIWTGGVGGQGYFNNSNTPVYLGGSGYFSLGDKLSWNGSSLSVNGNITVTGGNAATTSFVQSVTSDINAKIWTDSKGNLVAPPGAGSPSTPGLYLGAANLGFYSSGWKTYMDISGNFYLNGTGSNYLLWEGNALTISGAVNALSGNIGGWSIVSDSINNGTTYIKGTGNIYAGRSTYSSGTGWFLGLDSSTPVMAVGNSGGNQLKWTGSQLEVTGGIYITDTVGIRKLGGGTLTITGGSSNGYPDAQLDLAGSGGDAVLGAGSGGAVQLRTGNTARLTVASGGQVGIGSLDSSYKLTVDGTSKFTGNARIEADLTLTGSVDADGNVYSGNNITLNAGSGQVDALSFSTTSSLLYKDNIQQLQSVTDKVKLLRPVTFTWNNKTVKNGENDFGLIAEEVKEVFPELVKTNDEGCLSIDYSRLSVLLLKVIQDKVI